MSDINKVAIAAFGALLIVVFNSAYGVINARKQRVMAAQGDGRVALADLQGRADLGEPAADASSGLRSAVSMALVIVIVAEMFIGSDSGLGHRIIDAQQVLNVKSMYAAILAAGALGYALNVLFLVAERRDRPLERKIDAMTVAQRRRWSPTFRCGRSRPARPARTSPSAA